MSANKRQRYEAERKVSGRTQGEGVDFAKKTHWLLYMPSRSFEIGKTHTGPNPSCKPDADTNGSMCQRLWLKLGRHK